jgi:hypothetical protein
VWYFLGKQFLAHAMSASWGGLGEFYRDSNTVWGLIKRLGIDLGWAWIPIICLTGQSIRDIISNRSRSYWQCLVLTAPIVVYMLLYFLSPNRDDRFTIPVLICVPFFLVLATRTMPSPPSCTGLQGGLIAALLLIATLPVFARPNLDSVRRATTLIENLQPTPNSRMLLCTDTGHFNIETFILAQEMRKPGSGVKTIETSVYDEMHKRPPEYTLNRLKHVRTVVIQWPIPAEPAFTNTRAQSVFDAASQIGTERTELRFLGVRVFHLP